MKSKNIFFALIGALAAFLFNKKSKFCSRCNNDPCTCNSASATLISSFLRKSTIQKMVNDYRAKQLAVIEKEMNIKDTQSVWFDLESVKAFIDQIEKETQKIDPSIPASKLGIRFYNAAYPSAKDWDDPSIPTSYAEKHTLIMIPTLLRRGASGKYLNYDFNPIDQSSYSDKAVPTKEYAKSMAMTSTSEKDGEDDEEQVAKNHGHMIPPFDPEPQSY